MRIEIYTLRQISEVCKLRGGARVVEWDSLENCYGLRSIEGSNPSLPALLLRLICHNQAYFLNCRPVTNRMN
jgi:hypothetical protein